MRRATGLGAAFWLAAALSAAAQTGEFRGLWVDAWGAGFLDASQVTKLIGDCRSNNFNAVVVQMRRRGDAFYVPHSPNTEPRTTAISASFDALQDIITKAHTGMPRIEVHCWVTTQLIWSGTTPPSQGGHVFNLHPEYLTRSSTGTNYLSEGYYLDPGHPDAALWNYRMAMDIVSHYDVDGFHWDYIRYPATDSGYNPTALARYNAEFGLSGQPAPDDPQFSAWRRRQITDFLRWVNADLLAVKPNLQISCAVFGSRSDAYNARFQDWAAWNDEGIIDLCMPMDYSANNSGVFVPRCDDAFAHQGVRRVYIGQGAYLNTKENTLWQLQYVRNKPLLGYVLYSYRTPNSGTVDQAGTFAYLRTNHQPVWVAPPPLPWKVSPTKAILRGTLKRQDNGAAVYNATVTLGTTPARTQLSEAHGAFAFFETPPGTYTLSVTAQDLGAATTNVTLAAGDNRAVLLLLPPDSTPPLLTDITVSNVTDTAATVCWNTDDSATSGVDYGVTTAYGSAVTNATLSRRHALTLSGLTPATTYHYRVRSRNTAGLETVSEDFTLTTNPAGVVGDVIVESRLPDGSLNSDPLYADSGFANSTLKSTAPGLTGTGSRYATAGTPAYTIRPTLPVSGGTYEVYLTHGVATSISDDIVVAVSQTGCSGLPATTTVHREPGGNTWEYLGRMKLQSGVTVPSLSFSYASGALGSTSRMYSDSTKFVFVPPPTIVAQPTNATLSQSETVTFRVTATGAAPLSYQWYFGGSRLAGATASSHTLTNVQPGQAGDYQVVVTNVAGAVTSAPARLEVLVPPTITAQPQDLEVRAGAAAMFSVTATGSPPLGYQWRFNGAPLAGATQSTLTLPVVDAGHAGAYSVVVSNRAGTVTSSNAWLTVRQPQPGRFLLLEVQPEQAARLVVTGEPGGCYVTEVSSNLLDWQPLTTNWNTNGTFEVRDAPSGLPARFYRTRN